jgi:hypothetical protein
MRNESDLLGRDELAKYCLELRDRGTILIAPGKLFSADELAKLDRLESKIPEEAIRKGDADDDHNIFVKRIRVDHPGCQPSNANGLASAQIIELLEARGRSFALASIFGSLSDYTIRRCQMHRMVPGSFVGIHLDEESDPDFEYSVILQLARDFEGGEFVVYLNDHETQVFKPVLGSVLITSCKFRHEVRLVRAKERRSLVYFYSRHKGANRRTVEVCSSGQLIRSAS